MIQTSFQSSASPEDTFNFIASIDAIELFDGHLLVSGIKKATLLKDQKILVEDNFGLKHLEIISAKKFPELLVFYIVPNRILRLFIKSLSEEWLIEKNANGSRVTRSFSLAPRKWSGFLLPTFSSQLKRAVEINNQKLTFHLFIKNQELKKPLFEKEDGN
jgi:hypothetical protein